MLFTYIQAWLGTRFESERGATAVEYGLMVALIAAFLVGIIGFLADDVKGAFQAVVTAITGGHA